ncbi:hypothetical protein [Lyngbya aestuarii]|uniref:hypothetical protein n=1 Tax=Lyngbya aestuarii TaxID=118322 RepID=UPI00403DF85A
MPSKLRDLPITAEELEALVDLNLITTLAIDGYRAFILKDIKYLLSALLTEFFIFGLSLIFVLPVSLVILRSSGNLPEDAASMTYLLATLIGISCLGTVIVNIYLWKQFNQIKPLVKLLEKLEQYNGVIKALSLIEKLGSANPSSNQFNHCDNFAELIKALGATKASILSALQVENLLRKHQGLLEKRYELFSSLEDNLTTLMTFDLNNQTSDYRQLMNEALEIGISVQKEVRNLRNQSP